ncbi:uncharacterized protein LOC117327112 [Pecten maximus]|uniref:uncharacterized protein LOC117327112 n=1 Tax=Pecten maximus TaxID=6579 RepID=UPI001458C807|nr:uncharacterized protein LOC117327112 [Pecten maximus]
MRGSLLLLLMAISRISGFYITDPSPLSSDRKFYQISSNDLLSLTRCEKKITFNDKEDLMITYLKRTHRNDTIPGLDVFLELSALNSGVAEQTRNISGFTPNMTRFTLHGNNVMISLHPNYCDQQMLRVTTYFIIFVSVTKPSDRCADPGTPENSVRSGQTSDFVVGENIRFFCNHGYVLSGSRIISCARNPYTGIPGWTGSKPICVRQCETPLAPKFGRVSQTSSYGSVRFTCQSPFSLVGPEMITCLDNGAKPTWNDFPPKCIVTTCPSNGSVLKATYDSKFIATPSFPGNIIYSNMTCKWYIRSRDNTCIHIYFENFDLPKDVVFEIHKYVGNFSDDRDRVWSSRSGGEGHRKTVIVCDSVIRVTYTSREVAVTGHSGVYMRYQSRPISVYHAAYQRAARLEFNDQISVETTMATGQSEADDGSGVDVPAIAAGVTVSVIVLIIVGVAVYIWYRKKYPVRMIIGKDFGKFTNPVYNRKTSTATLTRPDSFEKEIEKMAAEKCVSHDNHVDLSDEQEYQPTAGLTLLGSLGIREGLDDFDNPEMKKRNNTKQRKKIVPTTKVVIEEEEEEEKDEGKNLSNSSSESSPTDDEKSSASDEDSDGEGFRPVTDAPKIKRKRVSAYLNEVLDRQSSQDSADGESIVSPGVIPEKEPPSDGVDVVVHTEIQKQNDESVSSKEDRMNKEDIIEESNDVPKESDTMDQKVENENAADVPKESDTMDQKVENDNAADVPKESETMEQKVENENAEDVSQPDRPMTVLKLGIEGFNFANEDDDESSHSSTNTETADKVEESSVPEIDITLANVKEIDFTADEIMAEVKHLVQEEAKITIDDSVRLEPSKDADQLEHDAVSPKDTDGQIIEEVKAITGDTEENDETDAVSGEDVSDEKNSSAIDVGNVYEADIDPVNVAEVSNEDSFVGVVSSVPSEETQQELADHSNDRDVTHIKMTDTQTDTTVDAATTESTLEVLEGQEHNTYANQDIIGYLTKDEMRELTARTKSFGEDSLSSVYSGEMVEEDNPVAEIPEQDFSSGLSLDETDSLEVPYKSKVEVQFEKLIQDIDNHSNSSDIEKEDGVAETTEHEVTTPMKEESTALFDLSFANISNGWNGETSDLLPHSENSDSIISQVLTNGPSLGEDFVNATESTSSQALYDLSFLENTNISREVSSAQPITLVMSGFDTGESSTDVQNQEDIAPNDENLNGSSLEDDSDSSKISNEDLIEYIVNPETNEDNDEEDEGDDQVDELQLMAEVGGKGKRRSISLENPLFDTLDFSKFQPSVIDSKQDDSNKESDIEDQIKPPAIGRRESISLDNPFFNTDDHELQEQSHQGEKLRVIQVSNLLVTPPTSSNESSSDDSDSDTGSVGEYHINPSSDHEDAEQKPPNDETKQDPNLPVGVMNFLSVDSQSEHTNPMKNKTSLTIPLEFDPRKRTNLEPEESDASSLDSATMKEIEELSSDSEANSKDHGGASAKASAPAPKKFSLSSISRKFKSSFKTTTKPDLQTGDGDMVDV